MVANPTDCEGFPVFITPINQSLIILNQIHFTGTLPKGVTGKDVIVTLSGL